MSRRGLETIVSCSAFQEVYDIEDGDVLADLAAETDKLRTELTNRWINNERFIAFFDKDRAGRISYDEFFDGLSQFGLTEYVDADKVFAFVDNEDTGYMCLDKLTNTLKIKDKEALPRMAEEDDDEELAAFPETLLVGLVAHNDLKPSMMAFVEENLSFFKRVNLVTTGSTGRALTKLGLTVDKLVSSGPLGGDQEIGGMIAQGKVAAVFFFTDPLSAHPHAADINALNRICCVHDTMFANNPSTATALIYALEYSAYGFSRLIGENPDYQKKDSDIVDKYKANQKKVIASVQPQTEQQRMSTRILSIASSERSRKSSVLHAPARASILHVSSLLSSTKTAGGETFEVKEL